MCTYVTNTVAVSGSGYAGDNWFALDRAVVYFDHPQDAKLDHALCIDVWSSDGTRIAIELDADSARGVAHAILGILDDTEVQHVLQPLAVAHQGDV